MLSIRFKSDIKLLALITLATVETRTATVTVRAEPIVGCTVAIIAIAPSQLTAETKDTLCIIVAHIAIFTAMHGVDTQTVAVETGANAIGVSNAAVISGLTKAIILAPTVVALGSYRTILYIGARTGEANCCLTTTLSSVIVTYSPAILTWPAVSTFATLVVSTMMTIVGRHTKTSLVAALPIP